MREDGAPEAAGASQVWGAAGAQTAATACGAPRGLGSTRWGPPPRAPGFPSAASRRRPAPNTGGLRKWRRAEGLRFRLGREAAGERSLKTLPPGEAEGAHRPALGRAGQRGRKEKGERKKGSRHSRVMATAAAPTCLRCVPSFGPTLQAPPPPRDDTESSPSSRPCTPGRRLSLGRGKHVERGATRQSRRAKSQAWRAEPPGAGRGFPGALGPPHGRN